MVVPALRDYQAEGVEAIRDHYRSGAKSVLYVLPTGGGKTVTFSYIVGSSAAKGKNCLILAHRRELVEQASATFGAFGIAHGQIMAGRSMNRQPVQIGMVGAVVNRVARIPAPNLIVIDEAHHSTAATYRKILDAFPGARILGVTATPQRTDGAGLGDIFSAMVSGPPMRALIGSGALAPYTLFGPPQKADLSEVKTARGDYDQKQLASAVDRATVTGDAIEHYLRICPGKRAAVFCVGREHAEHVAESFRNAAVPAARIDGTMDAGERSRIIAAFVAGDILALTSADLISEGFDVPMIEAAILLRPTQSVIVYLQQVGRAMRPSHGKDRAIILDHVGNFLRHGFPDDDREWTLEGRRKGEKRQIGRMPITTCGVCFAAYPPSLGRCPHCNAEREVSGRTIEYVDGNLIEITRDIERQRQTDAWAAAERAQGRSFVMWPMLNGIDAGIVPASIAKATVNGRRGVALRLMDTPVAMFRPFQTMSLTQLQATGRAFGYHHRWATRAHENNILSQREAA